MEYTSFNKSTVHKILLVMSNGETCMSQELRVIEEQQGHIRESGVEFYEVQLISPRKQNLCLPVLYLIEFQEQFVNIYE